MRRGSGLYRDGVDQEALCGLNPHDAKTVAKQLRYRIPESKDGRATPLAQLLFSLS